MIEPDDSMEPGTGSHRPPPMYQLRRPSDPGTMKRHSHLAISALVVAAVAGIFVVAVTGVDTQSPRVARSEAQSGGAAPETQIDAALPTPTSDTVPSPALTVPSTEALCHADDIEYAAGST